MQAQDANKNSEMARSDGHFSRARTCQLASVCVQNLQEVASVTSILQKVIRTKLTTLFQVHILIAISQFGLLCDLCGGESRRIIGRQKPSRSAMPQIVQPDFRAIFWVRNELEPNLELENEWHIESARQCWHAVHIKRYAEGGQILVSPRHFE
jgi:hypothetical protein